MNIRPIQYCLALALLLVQGSLYASSLFSPYSLTDGGASHHGAMNLSGNPAAPASIRWEYSAEAKDNREFDSGFALGIARGGGGYSYGEVDNIVDEIDRVYDDLGNDSISLKDLNATFEDVESVLQVTEREGYVNINGYASALPVEVASQGLGGVWSLHPQFNLDLNTNFTGSSVTCSSVFDVGRDPVSCAQYVDDDDSDISNCTSYILGIDAEPEKLSKCLEDVNDGNYNITDECSKAISGDSSVGSVEQECSDIFTLGSDSAINLKVASYMGLGLGYSAQVYQSPGQWGSMFLGIRGEYLGSTLYQARRTHTQVNDEYDGEVDEMIDDIISDYNDNATTDSGFAVDLGWLWTMKYGRIGLSMQNAIAPEFAYTDENNQSQKFQLPQQNTLELSLYPEGRWVHLSYVQELDEAEAFSGEKTQWTSMAVGFTPYFAFAHARVGRRTEQVSELTYTTFGLSLFSVVHADVAISDQTVEVEGSSSPRSLYGSVSVEFIF